MATTAITRTFGSGDTLKWTYSFWVKRGTVSSAAYQYLFIGRLNGTNVQEVYFHTDDTLAWYNYKSGYEGELKTTRLFRDPNAWMHIQLVWDSANGVSGDRMIIYVNGVRETAFSTENYPGASDTSIINTAVAHAIGWHVGDSDKAFDGSMSHVQFVNAEALAPTEFGEVDSTSGIWKIKTGAYATPGTNGFFLKMEDRTNLDLDSSSNAYTFSTTGTLTATYDNPSNNFCVMNPLDNWTQNSTFTTGNLSVGGATSSGTYAYVTPTMGVFSGKWYWEVKFSGGGANALIGIIDKRPIAGGTYVGYDVNSYGYHGTAGNYYNNASGTSYGNSYTTGDIIGVYLDLDNNKIYWGKDGVVQNSGTGVSITAPSSTTNSYYMAAATYWDTGGPTFMYNFGNGYFGTTAVTSSVADEGGIGAFEYDPSAGTFDGSSKDFRAICTKNIKAYGG